eukprot:TRINITY_DN3918_c0_g1_i3.p1 TRINITY_DN3918_c0_g1~~TRINITY_DN3918_c0_g1_i3.p1  ORF type:complete len:114 (-),score=7.37 TRINITY_DN3918_c0_g1_i3:61-402(-)
MLLFLHRIYIYFYLVLELLSLFLKNYKLSYPRGNIAGEYLIFILLLILQFINLYIGAIGNKTESSGTLIWFLLICFPLAFAYCFFFFLQSYVLMLEIFLNGVGLVFLLSLIHI